VSASVALRNEYPASTISQGVVRKISKAIDESEGAMTHDYKVEVSRDGRWWMTHLTARSSSGLPRAGLGDT
jgi:hypothetical protein